MNNLRQVVLGVLAALLSTLIILGSLTLSFAEGGRRLAQAPASVNSITPANTPAPGEPTFTPSPLAVFPTATDSCSYPPGWSTIHVQIGDTFDSLAQTYHITVDALRQGNCQQVGNLLAGVTLHVPPLPPTVTPTPTFTSPPPTLPRPTAQQGCDYPSGWVRYLVKPGDNLYRIGLAYGLSVAQLQAANCLPSDNIRAGTYIYVPNVPTRVPSPTLTPLASPTFPPAPTHTPTNPPAPTTTRTPSPTPSPVNTLTPTNTPVPPTATGTNTPVPTQPPKPTNTPPPFPFPSPTDTPPPGFAFSGQARSPDANLLVRFLQEIRSLYSYPPAHFFKRS